MCDQKNAVTVSLENNQRFCDNCYQKKRRDMQGHRMRVIMVRVAFLHCVEAVVLDTSDSFSPPCLEENKCRRCRGRVLGNQSSLARTAFAIVWETWIM